MKKNYNRELINIIMDECLDNMEMFLNSCTDEGIKSDIFTMSVRNDYSTAAMVELQNYIEKNNIPVELYWNYCNDPYDVFLTNFCSFRDMQDIDKLSYGFCSKSNIKKEEVKPIIRTKIPNGMAPHKPYHKR